MTESMSPSIRAFFDEATHTVSYLVWDDATLRAAIIDPVLNFEAASGHVSKASADSLLAAAAEHGLRIERVLETHAHADHLSAAHYLKHATGARVGIGARIVEIQAEFAPRFGIAAKDADVNAFDDLFEDGASFSIGDLTVSVIHTPGHTPACVAYRIGDCVFVGDTLFMPDFGTARTDFPGGSAAELYRSIQRLLALPERTRIYMCHDYKPPGRDHYAWESTIAEQRATNVHVREGITEQAFIAMRNARDAQLPVPALLLPALQVNIRGGRMPQPSPDGVRCLNIPLTIESGWQP